MAQRLFGQKIPPVSPVTLARQVIDKYGAESPKPSVTLAKALLDGAHERDNLRTQLHELEERMRTNAELTLSLSRHQSTMFDKHNTTVAAGLKAASDLADQMMKERDAALLKYENAQERIAELEQQTCARHAGQAHGKEAEELRAGIEQILRNTSDVKSALSSDALGMVLVGMRRSLQFLLDNIDARDSLAYLEARDAEGKPTP